MQASEQAPVACTLDSSDMGPRLARIGKLTREHLRSHRLDGASLHLTYDRTAAEEVASIVELERQCCAFLDFGLDAHGDVVKLDIIGPPQNGADTQWLFAQFLPAKEEAAPATGCACCGS